MNIAYTSFHQADRDQSDPVAGYVIGCLYSQSASHDPEDVEPAFTAALCSSIGTLCEILADKGILSVDDILRIAGGDSRRYADAESDHALRSTP